MHSDELLFRLKQDFSLIQSVLGIQKDGNHCPCPLCGDKTSLRVSQDSKTGSGVWLWQCMKGCGKGTVVDAIMATKKLPIAQAIAELKRMAGITDSPAAKRPPQAPRNTGNGNTMLPPPPPVDKVNSEPTIDQDRANQFIEYAHQELVGRPELHKWLTKRRVSMEVATKFRLGFIDSFVIKMLGKNGRPDFDWPVNNAWVLPITNDQDKLMAVKLHFEVAQKSFKGKSLWMPFGTWPKHDRHRNIMPQHSYYTLWPHLGSQRKPLPKFEDIHNINWWICRASTSLRDEFNQAFEMEKLTLAEKISKLPDDFSASELEHCLQLAFESKRAEIQKYVNTHALKQADPKLISKKRYDYVVFAPGELKALAEITAGERATSCTGGEGALPPPSMFSVFQGHNVLIKHDDDIPWINETTSRHQCAGRAFVYKLASMMYTHHAREVREYAHGRQ